MGIFPFTLPFFLEEMGKADAGQAATSSAPHWLSGTALSCLSKRWGSGHWRPSSHPSRSLRRLGVENVVASRRRHQWNASHSPHHRHLWWELPLPSPILAHSHRRPCLLSRHGGGWHLTLNAAVAFLPSSSGTGSLKSASASAGWRHCLQLLLTINLYFSVSL